MKIAWLKSGEIGLLRPQHLLVSEDPDTHRSLVEPLAAATNRVAHYKGHTSRIIGTPTSRTSISNGKPMRQ